MEFFKMYNYYNILQIKRHIFNSFSVVPFKQT